MSARTPASAPAPHHGGAPGPVLAIEHLAVGYDGCPVLSDVMLTIGPGEVVALLGANGSGKSTMIKTVLGIVAPTSGTVRVLGADIRDRRAVPWRRVGYVPQRMTATSGVPATAAETVAAGLLDRTRLRPSRRDSRRRVHAALDSVGLADRASTAVQYLSGGQQQRVLLARALVREPDLLILDEPLAGMDQPSQETTRTLLRRLVDGGTSVLVVLHEVGPLAELLTRAVVLRHGRIVHDGPPPASAPGHDADDHDHDHHHPEHEPYRPEAGWVLDPSPESAGRMP